MRNSGGKEGFTFDSVFLALVRYSFADCCDHFRYIFPGDGGLERLSDEVVSEAEVSDIADHEGQEVTSFSVLRSSFEPFMFFGQSCDIFLLKTDFSSGSFEENGAESHFGGIKAHNLSDKVFFGSINGLMELIFLTSIHREERLVNGFIVKVLL